MAERDRFELDLAAAMRVYLDDAPTQVRPTELARQFASTYPRRRGAFGPWSFGPARALGWLLLLAGLLLVVVGGTLIAGSQLRRLLPAVVPPMGQLYECPPGSTPDKPGAVDQPRPAFHVFERIVFDRRAGRVVAVTSTPDGLAPETWTFDLCTNTWTQMHPDRELPDFVTGQLVYDVDSDATIAILSGKVWAYDLQANTWTEKGAAPSGAHLGVYDPVSGLVVAASAYDLVGLWTYDVETDTWTQIRQVTGELCGYVLFGYDASVDRIVTYRGAGWGKEEVMCLLDRTGSWLGTHAVAPPDLDTGFYASNPSIVYDEATERTVFSDGRRLVAYDATADRSEILEADPGAGLPLLIVYDPLHRRLAGFGRYDGRPDVAFDPVTRDWTVLLDRDPAAGPWPTPTPVPTGLEPATGSP